MLRTFRPVFEKLENREVFSAGPLAIQPLNIGGQGSGGPLPPEAISFHFDRLPVAAVARHNALSNGLLATTYGRSLTSDFNNDGNLELAIMAPRDSASGLPTIGPQANLTSEWNHVTGSVKVENAAVHVAAGDVNNDGQANLARHPATPSNVLIGMLLPYMEQSNVSKLAPAPASTTAGLVNRDAAAHDAVFAELGAFSDSLPRGDNRNQIIAVLIGL